MITIWLVIILLFLMLGIFLFFRYKTWKPLMLETEIDSKVNVPAPILTVGMTGKTISRLAPGGKAVFEDTAEEVFSQHEFIDENKQVVITKIEGSKIIVKLNT